MNGLRGWIVRVLFGISPEWTMKGHPGLTKVTKHALNDLCFYPKFLTRTAKARGSWDGSIFQSSKQNFSRTINDPGMCYRARRIWSRQAGSAAGCGFPLALVAFLQQVVLASRDLLVFLSSSCSGSPMKGVNCGVGSVLRRVRTVPDNEAAPTLSNRSPLLDFSVPPCPCGEKIYAFSFTHSA